VLVRRKIKIVFLIQSSNTANNIRTFVNNNVYPQWDDALADAFVGYQFANTIVSDFSGTTKVVGVWRPNDNNPSGRWVVYPKYFYQGEVTGATQQDARSREITFLQDARNRTRDLLAGRPGTTVLSIYRKDIDGFGHVEAP
jgi:hypothetical protein